MRRTALSSLSLSAALLIIGPSAIATELRMPPAIVGEWHADNQPCGTVRSAVDGLLFKEDGHFARLNGAENCQMSKLAKDVWDGGLGRWSFEATCQEAETRLSGASRALERRVTGSLYLDDDKQNGLILTITLWYGGSSGFFAPNGGPPPVSDYLQRCPK